MSRLSVFLLMCTSIYSADLKIGIIGTDTSHVPAFTKMLNDATAKDHISGVRVVAAYKGGSQDIPESRDRVEKFAAEIQSKYGVEIVPDIETLCKKVDAVLIESVDGRTHLAQAKPVIAAHKPFFVDKPLAATLEDAREIAKLAKAAGVPWFSSSSLRYGQIATTMKFEDANGAITWGPGPLGTHHQLDLSWYAIHPIELLFALLGTGVEEVTRITSADADEVTGRWKNGKLGTVRAVRPYSDYGAIVFRPKLVLRSPDKAAAGYAPLVEQIVKFFQTGKPPVSNEETLEIFAFMDAAQRSKAASGQPMRLR
ncbi:MAG TPA: Gfo/Idh/MocA family oxidoreductase [Bryobacteraceae bacterium]|nr:Gfo/Idh/MocA family oxidoreductase [Bryobacteraceae bacterium]